MKVFKMSGVLSQHLVKFSVLSAVHVFSDIRILSSEWILRSLIGCLVVSASNDPDCMWCLISDDADIGYASYVCDWMIWRWLICKVCKCGWYVWVVSADIGILVCFSKNLPKGEITHVGPRCHRLWVQHVAHIATHVWVWTMQKRSQ